MIGLYGGSFAPLHNGHLRFAIEALECLDLERVHMITCAQPPHRNPPTVDPRRRHDWLRLVVDNVPGLVADDDELTRDAMSYSVDTLRRARQRFPGETLLWLVGADAFNNLHCWHAWESLFTMAHLVVAGRPGHPLAPHAEVAAFPRVDAGGLRQNPHGCWHSLAIPEMDVASTGIRTRIEQGRSLRGLVPDVLLDTLTPSDLANLAAYRNA